MKKILVLFIVLCMIGTSAFGAITVLEIPIANDYNDYEEHLNDGRLDFSSTDLEFPYEDVGPLDPQLVGLFFTGVGIEPGTQILDAYVRFDQDETKVAGEVNVLIWGVLSGIAPLLSDKILTANAVQWSPPDWTGSSHQKRLTADISAVIQEIIDQPGWTSGGTIGLIISDDPDAPSVGIRTAESFKGAMNSDAPDRIPTLFVTIPEPATMVLLGLGGLALLRRRRA